MQPLSSEMSGLEASPLMLCFLSFWEEILLHLLDLIDVRCSQRVMTLLGAVPKLLFFLKCRVNFTTGKSLGDLWTSKCSNSCVRWERQHCSHRLNSGACHWRKAKPVHYLFTWEVYVQQVCEPSGCSMLEFIFVAASCWVLSQKVVATLLDAKLLVFIQSFLVALSNSVRAPPCLPHSHPCCSRFQVE